MSEENSQTCYRRLSPGLKIQTFAESHPARFCPGTRYNGSVRAVSTPGWLVKSNTKNTEAMTAKDRCIQTIHDLRRNRIELIGV